MPAPLAGRVAIVTGASRGIGRAIAERLAAEGAAVAIGYARQVQAAEAALRAIVTAGGEAITIACDVTRAEQVAQLFARTTERLGAPDIVVANAGMLVSGSMADASVAEFDACFAVNTRGAFLTLAEAARLVRDGGRLIAISSNLTIQPVPGYGLYAASKAAVEQFVRVLARELGHRGVTVNAVAPGPTDTDMLSFAARRSAPAATPLGRVGQGRDIADVVAFLAGEGGGWITGQVIHANGGLA